MQQTELSEAKRALLQKYLRGKIPQTPTTSAIPRRAEGSSAPLSSGQQQLWLIAQLLPATLAYNESVTIHLPGPLDVATLERSFNEILRRNEAWRTSFPMIDGQPIQMIHPSFPHPLLVIDLRHLSEQEREAEALRLVAEDAQQPFDLANGPLLRTLLVQFNDEDHRLFLNLHHIIFDAYSLYQVLLPELRTLYEAFLAGKDSPLPELPIQYPDFAVWQREQLQGNAFAEQLDYWKKQLADAPTYLELPTDHPRLAVQTSHGSMLPFVLPQALTEALKTLSGQEGATLFITLTAAFNSLLYRYTAQENILIGTSISDRKYPEVQRMMGFFLNTLVLHTDFSGNPTFRELLQRVREVALEAHAHQDIPFEQLVKELHPERNPGQNPLFQVMLSLQPPIFVHPSGWTLTQMDVRADAAKFDLYLELDDRPDGIIGRFEYNTDLFDAKTIARMAEHWQILLDGIVKHPEQSITELPLLSTAERHKVLVDWNNTRTPYPRQAVHRMFEDQVERSPDAIALMMGKQELTYGELNARANQLAHHLQKLEVQTETRIGICMDRSVDMVVGLLGILKAGGVYVPLDPAYPEERLAFMLADTQASILLTQERYADMLPARRIEVICLDTLWPRIAQECTENLDSEVTDENLAYVMYTSGSTGRPKGIEIRHCSMMRLLFGGDYVCLDADQVILHMASISFDASTFELWGALLHGARCILYPEQIPTPQSLGSLLSKHGVTTLWLTASLFNAIIDDAPDILRGVRQLLIGGEALSVTHVRRALAALPSTQIINGYGPTESTTFTCCYPIPEHFDETTRSIPIGRPIGNTQVYILDHHMNPVPIGVAGELHIGGDGLARGYLNHPELTKEKFIPDPFSNEPGARLYKTGDLARYLADGTIEFLGRLDTQVKIRGFRIEPGEIEAILGRHPSVREVSVLVRENERGEKQLVAYVVPQRGQGVTPDRLRNFLKKKLPEYMVPSHVLMLDVLPLSPNGKLDTHALPSSESSRDTAEKTYVAPTSMLHQQLAEIWEDLLNVRPIGIRDNFFYLGGHSLLAARLVDRIEQRTGGRIPLATLFAGPTIEQLAEVLTDVLTQDEQPTSHTPLIAVQRGGSKRPFFFLHGDWTSNAFYCFTVARDLGPDQPFYVLEPYRLDGLEVLPTFEEMAAAHIESLRVVQPKGPYLLGGFCNGGLMAYEMARQLRAAGENVDLLILIDPSSPAHSKRVRNLISRFNNFLRKGQQKSIDWFLRIRHLYKFLQFSRENRLKDMEYMRTVDSRLLSPFPAAEILREDYVSLFAWVDAGYVGGEYLDKIALLWAADEPFRGFWQRRMQQQQNITFDPIPGTHITCRTDHVHALAEQLHLYLDHVQTEEVRR